MYIPRLDGDIMIRVIHHDMILVYDVSVCVCCVYISYIIYHILYMMLIANLSWHYAKSIIHQNLANRI